MKAIKHPGPFIGPDAEIARACAIEAIEWYGSDTPEDLERMRRHGIWNDHVAVQSALCTIATLRAMGVLKI